MENVNIHSNNRRKEMAGLQMRKNQWTNAIHPWKTGKVRTLVDQQKLKETNRAQTFKISIIDCQLALMNYQKMCLVIVELHPCITNQRARPVRRGLDISWFLFLPTINAPYT
jgi:hypothetical protein